MFYVAAIFSLFFSLTGLVVYLWNRERKYLKRKTSQAMSQRVWKEVVIEREEALKKRRLFREALERAKQQQGI